MVKDGVKCRYICNAMEIFGGVVVAYIIKSFLVQESFRMPDDGLKPPPSKHP